jgi:hypothetical protein
LKLKTAELSVHCSWAKVKASTFKNLKMNAADGAMNEYKEYRICIKAYDINLYEHAVKKWGGSKSTWRSNKEERKYYCWSRNEETRAGSEVETRNNRKARGGAIEMGYLMSIIK